MLVTYPDSRFLVFTESLQTCSIIESTMPQKCVALTGDLGESERRRLVAEFRDPASSVRVLVATSAADEGFDFQVANRVVHWDLSSSPATLMQRNGRVARLGQVADVTAYYLILPGTHEERRDRTLQRHFAELGVGDIQLQLKILGTLTEDEQARLDEAIEHESEMVVEEILKRARAGNTEMDRKLQEVRKPLEEVAVLDRDQLATRLEVWNKLELPSQIEDISVTFDTVRWQKPMFGARTTVVESAARTAIITSASLKREVTFDPEFLLFSKTQRAYELAGLRPWTPRREQDGQVKIRPDPTVDLIGKMACGLARLPRADFAAIGRKALALCIPELDHAEYLLFVTHPMREAETIRPTPRASYITFFAFTEASTEPLLTADGSQVHKIVSLLEREAFVRRAPLTKNVAEVHFAAGKRYCEWLRQQVRIGRSGFRGGADYYVPIPIALVAVDAVNASRDIVAPPDVSSALDLIRGALEHGAETEAVDLTVELFDGLLLASDFDGAGRVLQVLDPRVLPPKVLTGVLMITRYAREKLGENRRAFLARVESALSENWHLNADDVAAIIRRLA